MCIDPISLTALGIGAASAASAGTAAAGAAGAAATGLSTLQMVGLGLTALSTGVGLFGQLSTASAQSNSLQAQAASDRRNADLSRQQGEEESDRRRRAGMANVSEQKARAAAAGIDPTRGTALDLIDDSEFLVEDDAFIIRTNAERRAAGFSEQASLNTANSANVGRSGLFNAGGTLLTGASSVASKWDAFRSRAA